IKFMLPNEHAIYLHDTPDRNLFEFQERNFSSGCIRVADPLGLSRWVLSHTNQLDTLPLLENMWLSEETHTINLKKHLPVLIVYFTAFADMNNDVVFRRDVYQRDVQINEKLKEYRSE
ncbi:MAG: L,D-transpeptidase family protein, partial [Pseudomonadota bacterium]|nr:L,D-transpeptidase family protein [Pseudomonadota bacterium]